MPIKTLNITWGLADMACTAKNPTKVLQGPQPGFATLGFDLCSRELSHFLRSSQVRRDTYRINSNLFILSRETGISGNFVGRIKGAKCPFDLQFLTWDFS